MDRFIGGYELREDYTYFDLKSNMDRFIVKKINEISYRITI